MTRQTGWIAAAAASCVGVSAARGTLYVGSVLYPLAMPAGFASVATVAQSMPTAGGQAAGYGVLADGTLNEHALLWSGTGPTVTDLNPTYYTYSVATTTTGTRQAGYGYGPVTNGNTHALLWNGSAGAAVDLQPTALPSFTTSSSIYGLGGTQQVGQGTSTVAGRGAGHALLWTGTAASAVDLHPAGFPYITGSIALATDGTRQVGFAQVGTATYRALLWSGTAASYVNLHPTTLGNYETSTAEGVGGGQQVGSVNHVITPDGFGPNTVYHAVLWTGTAASAVDLNPSALGIVDSDARATNGSQQAGYGVTLDAKSNPVRQALLWSGTAPSAVQLQPSLPAAGTWNASQACSVDASGDAFGLATGTYNGATGTFAVEWAPAPTVAVAAGQTVHLTAAAGTGIHPQTLTALTVAATGRVVADPAAAPANRQLLVVGTLSLAGSAGNWTGALDLGNNDLDLPGGSLATVTDQARQGYANGTWAGPGGLASAAAAADRKHLTAVGVVQNNGGGTVLFTRFDGQPVAATDVLAKYTYDGDANLDGVVNGIDYGRIDAGYAGGGTLTGWYNGDFNYDGRVDGSDYTLIDNAFDLQAAGGVTPSAIATSEVAAVPEPAAVGVVGALAAYAIGRRRRRAF